MLTVLVLDVDRLIWFHTDSVTASGNLAAKAVVGPTWNLVVAHSSSLSRNHHSKILTKFNIPDQVSKILYVKSSDIDEQARRRAEL